MGNQFLHLFRLAANACGTKTGILPSLYDNLNCDADGNFTLHSLQDIGTVAINIIQILLWFAGSMAIVTILVASVWYVTSMGDPSRVKRAKEIIVNTMIGLVIIMLAGAFIRYVTGEL